MDDPIALLEAVYQSYRKDLETAILKQRPADGLFGIGSSIERDPCHDRFDAQILALITQVSASDPSSDLARQLLQILLIHPDLAQWHVSAQWMLRAAERHALLLIPSLNAQDAAELVKQYDSQYKRWDRLPAQKDVYKALKARI